MSAIAGFLGVLRVAVFLSWLAFSIGRWLGARSTRSPNRTYRTTAMIPLIIAFGVMFCLALDLDRPQEGVLRVDQSPMMRLADTLQNAK